ncbi:hypothetical protein KIPB_013193, partial [Kipferlia bialata]
YTSQSGIAVIDELAQREILQSGTANALLGEAQPTAHTRRSAVKAMFNKLERRDLATYLFRLCASHALSEGTLEKTRARNEELQAQPVVMDVDTAGADTPRSREGDETAQEIEEEKRRAEEEREREREAEAAKSEKQCVNYEKMIAKQNQVIQRKWKIIMRKLKASGPSQTVTEANALVTGYQGKAIAGIKDIFVGPRPPTAVKPALPPVAPRTHNREMMAIFHSVPQPDMEPASLGSRASSRGSAPGSRPISQEESSDGVRIPTAPSFM